MPKKPLIYPDTELGNARKTLFEMLPEDLQNKSFGDIAWEWGYSGGTVVSFLSPTGTVGAFSVDNVHKAIMQHVENTEAKSDEVRNLLETIYKYHPHKYKHHSHKQERETKYRQYPDTELGNMRKELHALLPPDLINKPFSQITEKWGVAINTVLNLFSERVPIERLSRKAVNRLIDKFPKEHRAEATTLLWRMYEMTHPAKPFLEEPLDQAHSTYFSVEAAHRTLMEHADINPSLSEEIKVTPKQIRQLAAKEIYGKDELGRARKKLFDLFAEKLDVSHPSDIASKTTISKYSLKIILGPKAPPTYFQVKDAHHMIMETLELSEEKSDEIRQLLITIRSYINKHSSQQRGQ